MFKVIVENRIRDGSVELLLAERIPIDKSRIVAPDAPEQVRVLEYEHESAESPIEIPSMARCVRSVFVR